MHVFTTSSKTWASRKSLNCPSRLTVSANLRHPAKAVSKRLKAAGAPGSEHRDADGVTAKLPAALLAGACSFLLHPSAVSAADLQLASYTQTPIRGAAAVATCQHQAACPAALQDFSPAAAPQLLASTAQHAGPMSAQAGILQQVQEASQLPDQHTQPQQQQGQLQQQATAVLQQQGQLVHELQQVAQLDEPRLHWLLVVLAIGVVNIVGLQAVLKLLQASKDSSTPVTVLVCRMGLRVDSSKLQERLHFLRGMMGVENAIFFTFEEAMQAVCEPPRGCQLAYADLTATPLSSRKAGYELFKQKAIAEEVRAQQEEAARVVKGTKPEGPQHRNILQKLLGAAETQDVEEAQSCLLVSLVVLAKGTVSLPPQPLRDVAAFREAMKSLCGHLKVGQLLAVELLMTPDNPQDFLSEAQLMTDYPFLTDLSSGLRVDHPDWSPAPSPFASTDDFGAGQQSAAAAAAAMAAMAADAAGAEGAASAAAAAAAAVMQDERRA